MTRNHFTTSLSNSCIRVPVNPYSQQPSPSYERRRTEAKGLNVRKEQARPFSASSRAASSSHITKDHDLIHLRTKENGTYCDKKSPLDSFLDFYESIPDYQEVTHLSDSEFADKMKLLRDKQRQYLSNFGGKYNAADYEEYTKEDVGFSKKKSFRFMNKMELAKEWVNKSCESLSSLGKKSENDFRLRETEEDIAKKASPVISHSPRKYSQYSAKDEAEAFLMDTGSSLSTESNVLKMMRESRSSCAAMETDRKHCESSSTPRGDETPIRATNRLDSCKGLSHFYNMKESNVRVIPSSPVRGKNRPASCGVQSSGTSELNTLDCVSPLEEYYMPPGWLKSDSESILGTSTFRNTPYARRSHTQTSRSLPTSSPVLKRSGNCSSDSEKKKRKKKKRASRSKSPTKPVPFSFMRNENKHYFSRSTPDLISHCRSPSPKLFRARPIPRNLFSNYIYQKKQEEEFFRALKRKVRAEEMLRTASLPPSMEFRERLSRVQAEAEVQREVREVQGSGGSHSSDPERRPSPARPRRARRPPDFAKCHEKMRQQLSERRSRNITTSPSPYSLRTASLSPRRKDTCASPSSRCRPRSNLNNLSSTSRSNLAALLRIQSARQRLEEEHRRLRDEQLRRAQLRIKAKITRLTPAWRSIQYSTEEDLALRAAVRREEDRERRQEHGVLMRHMLHRVHTIPTLFERQSNQAPPYAYPPPRPKAHRSPRRSRRVRAEECGPSCEGVDDLDEDAADVMRGYMRGPKRPSSCGPTVSASAGTATRLAPRPSSSRVCLEQGADAEREQDDDYGEDDEEEVEEDMEDDEGEQHEQHERAASP